jgi:5-bromo-4-chloroindolyl phosphate hydrolysis protein
MADTLQRRRVGERRDRQVAAASAFLLFFLPAPLILKAVFAILGGHIITLAWTVGVYALFMVGAEVARKGLMRAAEQHAHGLSRAAGPPLRTFGAVIVALATFAAAWLLARHNIGISLAFAAAAGVGTVLLYGIDSFGVRAAVSRDDEAKRVADALDAARLKLARIDAAARRIADRSLQGRVDTILGEADKVLEEIARDPRDLRRARKFLNVYLDGAVDVVERYADTASRAQSDQLDDSFRTLLTDMEHVFREQHEKLLKDDVMDLNIQMDVLKTRLRREGVI